MRFRARKRLDLLELLAVDVGGSKYIIDGRIKLKGNCGSIKEFTEKGLRFDDGTELDADVVTFCTG